MKNNHSLPITLENFEGSLDFLFYLVQKNEIEICEIPLHCITKQYFTHLATVLTNFIDDGTDFIDITSTLLLIKSRTLLPKQESKLDINEEPDPRFEIIHQLLDYCRFKEAAKILAEREQQQDAFYIRQLDSSLLSKKTLGIEHLTINDLAAVFGQILAKSSSKKGVISEEKWRVSDKIDQLRQLFKISHRVLFTGFFGVDKCKEELIVIFLALLELIKLGEIGIIWCQETSPPEVSLEDDQRVNHIFLINKSYET